MKILGLLNSPWMIDQGTLTEITREYINHMKGEKLDFKALMLERDSGRPAFDVQGSTAIIPLKGVMTPGLSFFSFFFDGTSTKNVQRNIQAALGNSEIDKIIIDVNSGGGSVEGAFELADYIVEAGKQKEIIAFSDGAIASAAYLAVSGVSKIFITGKSNQIGSLGVIARRLDTSKHDKMTGLEVEEFVTGRLKNIMSQTKPIDDVDRGEIQAMVDKAFAPMVADISERRGLDPQQIVNMQGGVFIGAEAIENGLVDGVSTLDELINQTPGAANSNINQGANMNKDEFKANHQELFAEIVADTIAAQKPVDTAGITAKAQNDERSRIEGITSACIPGHEALMASMIADGKTQPGDAALRYIAADKQAAIDAGKNLDKPEPVAAAEPAAVVPVVVPEETKTPEEQFEASAELKAEFSDVEEFKAYLAANEGGQVNVFQGRDK